MGRKTLTAALVSLVLLLTISVPRWPALSAVGLNLNGPDGTTEQPKKNGNGLGQALSAPFRALSRLFGGGKKRNQRPEKLTQKDIAKFESAPPVNRVNDARPTAPPTAPAGDNSASEHLQKGRDFLNAGKLNEAIAELSLAASLDSASGEAHTLLGVAYDRKGLRDLAQQSFETALHAPDDQAMHLNNLGYLFYKNGEYDEAIKYLKRSVKINSEDKRVWNNLGMAQCGAGKFDDCYKSFGHAVGEFQARLKVAAYLERQDFSKEAIKQLEKARRLKTDSLELWSRLAVLYESVGRSADASGARASAVALRTVAAGPKQ
ncbi:MAG TPA: tetratricopeptide repeat protein [Pyrinomonadaceae bacterium]|nr:tetratricopeptide repeat protein [Pyrinomonadaceae bacterium]